MIPDLQWWGKWMGLLAAEGFALSLLAAICVRFNSSPLWRRWVWQSLLVLLPLVWVLEMVGGHGCLKLRSHTAPPEPEVTIRANVAPIDTTSIQVNAVPLEPREAHTASVAASQPILWPGIVWATGLILCLVRIIGTRALLSLNWLRSSRQRLPAPSGESSRSRLNALGAQLGIGSVRLCWSKRFRDPVAMGIFRPTVVVPCDFAERFSPTQCDAMMAHELAHLLRRDPLWLLVADLMCAVAWWHPASWWIRRQFRAACERVADEASTLVPEGRIALAEALVSFGRDLTAPAGLGVAGSGLQSDLAHRVQTLLAAPHHPLSPRFHRTAPKALLSGAVMILLALLTSPASPNLGGFHPVLAALQFIQPKELEQAKRPAEPSIAPRQNPSTAIAPVLAHNDPIHFSASSRSPNIAEEPIADTSSPTQASLPPDSSPESS